MWEKHYAFELQQFECLSKSHTKASGARITMTIRVKIRRGRITGRLSRPTPLSGSVRNFDIYINNQTALPLMPQHSSRFNFEAF